MEPGVPVWTIKPNWSDGMTERLEWLTDVLASEATGTEQRRSVRLSPRRSLEITVNPTRRERAFLDLLLHRLGSATWLFPLWFDVAKLSAAVEADDLRVEFDNVYREHGLGGFALLYKDAFNYEVISVSASDDGGLDLTDPIVSAWPVGTAIFPLRMAKLPVETSLSAAVSRVGQSQLLFTINAANDFDEVMPDDFVFEGAPVLTMEPDRSQDISVDHLRLSEELDNSLGLTYRADPLGRAFQVQGHGWQVKGREAHWKFRQFLYWLRGRQRSLWLPSFNEDIYVTRNAAAGAISLDIEEIGYAYVGGPVPGRDVLWIDGNAARITAMGASQGEDEERLRIGAGLAAAVSEGMTGSFLSKCRLNQDQIEITHHTDTDGVMEISATFQTFNDNRDPSGAIYSPIPETERNSDPCGVELITDYSILTWSTTFSTGIDPNRPAYQYRVDLYAPAELPTQPNGTQLGGSAARTVKDSWQMTELSDNGSATAYDLYEIDDYVNPASPHYQQPGYEWASGQLLQSLHWTADGGFILRNNFDVPVGGWSATVSTGYGVTRHYVVSFCRSAYDADGNAGCVPTTVLDETTGGSFPDNWGWTI